VVVVRGDLQVTLSPDQNKIHHTSDHVQVPQGSVTDWEAQIYVGAIQKGKIMKKVQRGVISDL
jgi:hypothetical protein